MSNNQPTVRLKTILEIVHPGYPEDRREYCVASSDFSDSVREAIEDGAISSISDTDAVLAFVSEA